MRIGELAKRSDLNVDTVRFYEKRGLMPPPPRRANGYREYAAEHLERLAFIRHCRTLGMSLDDVSRLLDFVARPEADCAVVNQLIDDQLTRVQERITHLRRLERQLEVLRTQCRTHDVAGHCGILQELVAAAHEEQCVCHADDIEPIEVVTQKK